MAVSLQSNTSIFAPLTIAACISLILAGCGGSSSGNDPVQPIQNTPLNGRVIDGYISGAKVFLDLNNNNKQDADEPSATSDSTGLYQLILTPEMINQLASSPVVAIASEGAIDLATGEDFKNKPVVLSTPPVANFKPDQAASFSLAITPFTTRVAQQTKDALAALNAGEITQQEYVQQTEQAKEEILEKTAEQLNIDPDKLEEVLFADFVQSDVLTPSEAEKLQQTAITETDNLQEEKEVTDQQGDLEDNQKFSVTIQNRLIHNWRADEQLWVKQEYRELETKGDSCTTSDWYATQTQTDQQWQTLIVNGQPLVYLVDEGQKIYCNDGTFTHTSKWENDFNNDNQRNYKAKSYVVGEYTATSRTFKEYIDEASVKVELPEWDNHLDDIYDDIDVKQAVLDGDMSKIDTVIETEEQEVEENGVVVKTENITEFSNPDFANPQHKEQRIRTIMDDGEIYTVNHDWNADGVINEITTKAWYFENGKKQQMPEVFSAEWLVGKTVYSVWYGEGEKLDENNNPVDLNDVPVVVQIDFKPNGVIESFGILNALDGDYEYRILDNKHLQVDDDQDYNMIVCGSTQDYIKTHYVSPENGVMAFDNVDLIFLDKNKALAFANGLTQSIPACPNTYQY